MVEENPSRWIKVKEGKTTFDKNSTSFDLQDTGFLDKNVWGLMSAKKWARKIIQWNKKENILKTNSMKDFWNKFTTRFAVPLLIVTQVITLYDGWESRIEERADKETLIHCINSHLHTVGEIHEVVDVDGNKIIFDDTEFDGTVDREHLGQIGCHQFAVGYILADQFTSQRTMDRWLGKVFWTYKNIKDRFIAWYEGMFRKKMLEDIRG